LIFIVLVGDHPVAGVVAQFAAALVVGQLGAGLVATPPA
jgi:p-aminobenzoyl-glutamate transporter AbgT